MDLFQLILNAVVPSSVSEDEIEQPSSYDVSPSHPDRWKADVNIPPQEAMGAGPTVLYCVVA